MVATESHCRVDHGNDITGYLLQVRKIEHQWIVKSFLIRGSFNLNCFFFDKAGYTIPPCQVSFGGHN